MKRIIWRFTLRSADGWDGKLCGSVHSRMTEALQKALEIRKVRKGDRIYLYSLQYVGRQWRRIGKEAKLDGVRIDDLSRTFGSKTGKAAQDDSYAARE